jgi:hypothetical protein
LINTGSHSFGVDTGKQQVGLPQLDSTTGLLGSLLRLVVFLVGSLGLVCGGGLLLQLVPVLALLLLIIIVVVVGVFLVLVKVRLVVAVVFCGSKVVKEGERERDKSE